MVKLPRAMVLQPQNFGQLFLSFVGIHSTLVVGFLLQRHMGNFVIQVYGPCVLLVVISWVSFWLNREATSDRISLGMSQWNFNGVYTPANHHLLWRRHNGADNDLFGFGSQDGFASGVLSHCAGLLCLYFFHVHFLYGRAGEWGQNLKILAILGWVGQETFYNREVK